MEYVKAEATWQYNILGKENFFAVLRSLSVYQ